MLTFLMPSLPALPQIDVPAIYRKKQALLALCAFECDFDQTLEMDWSDEACLKTEAGEMRGCLVAILCIH